MPVVTGYHDRNVYTYIIIINEALVVGSQMDHSLIKPNKIRHFGMLVSDDPYDGTRLIDIDHSGLFAPIQMERCTIYFETFALSNDDINQSYLKVLIDGELNGIQLES